jgi:O-antigen/teichoic acid export membrane protein
VSVLVAGTAFGHVITAAALPLATRLYSPADFSTLALFAGIVSIIGPAACLRFDIAIPMPEADMDAVGLLALSVAATAVVSLSAAVLAAMGASWLASGNAAQAALADWIWLLPVGIFSVASFAAFQSFLVREKAFPLLAKARVAQSAMSASAQLGLGWLGVGPVGLLIANILYGAASFPWLVWRVITAHGHRLRAISSAQLRSLAASYKRFPQFSTLESLANSASIQLPVILIATMAAGPEAGFLLLAMQVMQVPMAVIGSAVGQVYLSQAPTAYREGRLGPFTAEVLVSLMRAGTGPLLFAAIVSPIAFPLLFGAPWERAGWLVSWMVPWFLMQFLASPVSMALHVTGHQSVALKLQVIGLVVRVGAVIAAAEWAPEQLGEVYALSGFVFYAVYLGAVMSITEIAVPRLFAKFGKTSAITLAWVLAACALLMAHAQLARRLA